MLVNVIGGILAFIAVAMSYMSLKFRNILLNLGTAAFWAVFLAFMLINITPGSTWFEMFILAVAAFICAFALLSMFNRNGEPVIKGFTGVGDRSNDKIEDKAEKRGLMDLSPEEYREYARRRVQQGRRRNN